MKYNVDILVNGILRIRHLFKGRTRAQKYILEMYNAYSKDERFYIKATHYSNWGKFKKLCSKMCIDSMNIQTKNYDICIELNQI